MPIWKIAGVQMDCRRADTARNLAVMRERLAAASRNGARLVVFPECALCGYAFESKAEAWQFAEPVPGPSTRALQATCREFETAAIVGLLERGPQDQMFNACALLLPDGRTAVYRKAHLPCLGVDRFTTAGTDPFAVHEWQGLRIGMNICYDGSFPEASRVLSLLGADLIVLPTNWPDAAWRAGQYLVPARALENHVYYAAVNRVGSEGGFHFIGRSRIVDVSGDMLAASEGDGEEILYAEIDPERARRKRIVHIPGCYEVDRVGDRRPDLYGVLAEPQRTRSSA